MGKATMSRPKICLVKCYLEEETMQRRMNGIFAGEEDLCVLLIGNSLFLTIGQCLFFFFFLLLTLYTTLIHNTTLVCLLTQFTTIIQLQITDNYRDNYLQR